MSELSTSRISRPSIVLRQSKRGSQTHESGSGFVVVVYNNACNGSSCNKTVTSGAEARPSRRSSTKELSGRTLRASLDGKKTLFTTTPPFCRTISPQKTRFTKV
mmetsp:Transcript_9525/g.13179  ORF Transcript_9525/g.13179 Transcript_9525/m.13179 type:complete len:104 (-) Transcript_9525:350-661(-)